MQRVLGKMLVVGVLCAVVAGLASAAPSEHYRKQATWAETMVASRAALPAIRMPRRVRSTRWYVAEPVPADKDGNPLPTKLVDPSDAEIDVTAVADGKAIWTERKDLFDNGRHTIKGKPNTAIYLVRFLTVRKPTSLGYVPYKHVWLNGKRLGRDAAGKSVGVELKVGKNQLLIAFPLRRGRETFTFHSGGKGMEIALWHAIAAGFPVECEIYYRLRGFRGGRGVEDWFTKPNEVGIEDGLLNRVLAPLKPYTDIFEKRRAKINAAKAPPGDPRRLQLLIDAYNARQHVYALADVQFAPLVRAVADMARTWPDRFAAADKAHANRLAKLRGQYDAIVKRLKAGDKAALADGAALAERFKAFSREVLTANPLLDFDSIALVRRRLPKNARTAMSSELGLPSLNSHTHDTIPRTGWDNEIAVLTGLRGPGKLRTLWKPKSDYILSDIDLHFDGKRIMFSGTDDGARWSLFEVKTDGTGLAKLTPDLPDVDCFDSCYLPDDRIATTTTATYQGLPCENGSRPMASLYLLDPRTKGMRQFTFEQDSDWSPTVLNNGRLMYLRWEYTDTPHYFSRVLFHCNPDGTGQMEYYGSNSYWPNAYFYARPIPNHASMVVGIVGGHHGISRSGRLVILDPAKGRHEADGVVQEIPGWGKRVEPIIKDALVNGVWPHFLHPYPLSEKYFLVAGKMRANSLWGIYLVDVFDNMTLLKEVEGEALLEPIPLRSTKKPPVIADRIVPGEKEATVFLTDIYTGPGLKSIPRGTVKRLRVFSYHYNYMRTGGHTSVGVEAGWDIKRILGTVDVEDDGSACFKIPANTPVSLQPLDDEGRAVQLMRSWLVGMPGEVVSCVGCHEGQNSVTGNVAVRSARRAPTTIKPWYGPARPFGFHTEVQPVLDKYCLTCHDGKSTGLPVFISESEQADYRKDAAYMWLQKYVRRPGPESDYHLTEPMEYHADTSELVQKLRKGHYNVKLDREGWDRLYTWIDLNVPYRGAWRPRAWRDFPQVERRIELAKLYGGCTDNPEAEYEAALKRLAAQPKVRPVVPLPDYSPAPIPPRIDGWPFDATKAEAMQGGKTSMLKVGKDEHGKPIEIKLARIPAGKFVMGDPHGAHDEQIVDEVAVKRPFWMATCEVSNRLYALYDAKHDSRYVDMAGKDQSSRGYPLNGDDQPVVRVSWDQAMAFCAWLSKMTGRKVTLPTEAQWEWACRAGTRSGFWYGNARTDFTKFANLADVESGRDRRANPFPRVAADDDSYVTNAVAQRLPNPWGLHNMHGNAAEWTRSLYCPYPYRGDDGRNDVAVPGFRVARGGSWRDRPFRATSSFRLPYRRYQRVFNVGFRIVVEDDAK